MRKNKLRTQLLWVAMLTILLTLMATLVLSLVSERSGRRETVLKDLTRIWGPPQMIAGPVGLAGDRQMDLATLVVEGELKTSIRRKGIYKFPLYAAKLKLTGMLRSAGAEKIVLKSRARLRIEKASLGATPIYFAESGENGGYTYRAATNTARYATSLQLTVLCEGLQNFSMLPFAETTEVKLVSDWGDPGFFGDFLPAEYEVSKTGFNAVWKITQPLGKKIAEAFQVAEKNEGETRAQTVAVGYGVAFYQPVDIYQVSERSVKYAILFIALTLLTLFLFELISSAEIHPMQYFLAGLGLVIFYLLLLALSEYLGFTPAYTIAAVANIALLSSYCGSFLLSRGQALTFTAILSLLYTLLYVILQLEEAALLSGAVTLFFVLALTMYLTRKINWYQVGETN